MAGEWQDQQKRKQTVLFTKFRQRWVIRAGSRTFSDS